MTVFDVDDGAVQILLCQVMDNDLAGIPELGGKSMCELLEKIKYEKWNGELPTVSGSNAIVSMEGLK